jgi:MFS family permease
MHETGAQWLMTSLEPSPEMVSAVRTCMTIPVFCLALPAGVWADWFDRRRWLIAAQLNLLFIAATMAILAGLGLITPWLLLLLTAGLGAAMTLNQPAWQALTPELVPPALVPSAVSVGSISFNLARSLGPAIAGLLIAQFGVWCTFFFNAFSFLAVVSVLLAWKPEIKDRPKDDELPGSRQPGRSKPKFWDELRKGMFVVRKSKEVRNALLRLHLFAIPASILWSLLPLVATEKLGFQERGFGLCLGMIGAGAVLGAYFLPRARLTFSSETIVLASQLVFASICIAVGISSSRLVLIPLLLIVGACWMATMTTFNATAQVYLPRKFRARGMAAFLMAFSLGMAIGSAAWGWLALSIGISMAFVVSGILLITVAFSVHRLSLGSLDLRFSTDQTKAA